jgi:large conductance mechanosensitive channel
MTEIFKGFRDFVFRGNVVDLAVAVVIAAAFTAVVDGFTVAFIDPLLSLILGGRGEFLATVRFGPFPVGVFLSAVISFLIKAAVIYFFVVRPFSGIAAKFAAASPPAPDIVLLTEIRDELKKQNSK